MNKQITLAELVILLSSQQGQKNLILTTVTDPKLKKTNNPFESVSKKSTSNVTINFDYENEVNRQRVCENSENNFVKQPRKWGHRINDTCVVLHNNKYYIEVKVNKTFNTEYIDNNNVSIDKELLREFMPAKSKAKSQELDKDVIIRDYSLSTITEVIMDGEKITVI